MTKDQLIELILDHYSLRKDAKAFLVYFIDPNPTKLFEDFLTKSEKEIGRSKRGHSKARISTIKRLYSNLESFQPGDDILLDAMFCLIKALAAKEKHVVFSTSLVNGTFYFIDKYLTLANRNYVLDNALSRLDELIEQPQNVRRSFKCTIKSHISEWLESSSQGL